MEKKLIFKNSKTIIKEGTGNGEGILYCGKEYTNNEGCQCGTCDGKCGPNNGCACPDCENTLGYLLYTTGKMKCNKCEKSLIRINLFNLKALTSSYNILGCDICKKKYKKNFLPVLHCFKCKYDICPKCAFSKINLSDIKNYDKIIPNPGKKNGEGILYCGKEYTTENYCICGDCDGKCGKTNGCPCSICSIILGYNLYLNNKFYCDECCNLLVKTTLKEISKHNNNYENGFRCNHCTKSFKDTFCSVYHCYKCNFDLCQICSYKNLNNKKIEFPNLPEEETLEKKISNLNISEEKNDKENIDVRCVICLENNKNYLFLPCKHLACCENCSKNIKNCPICRKKIDSTLKIYI